MDRIRDRIVEFDALRGIASLMVMVHHGILVLDPSYWTSGRRFRLTPLASLEVGRPMVVFFFVLSGVVLTRALMRSQRPLTGAGFGLYAAQRGIRLCLPAAAATLFSFGLYAATFDGMPDWAGGWLRNHWSQPPSLPGLLQHALLIGDGGTFPFNEVLWSLAHELRLSILLPLLVAVPLLRRPGGWLGLAAIGFAGPAVAGLLHPACFQYLLGDGFRQTVFVSLYFFGAFMVGAAYAFADAGALFRTSRLARMAVCLLVPALLCVTYDPCAVVLAVLLLWLAEQRGGFTAMLRAPALQALGKVSFSLYLAHMPVLLAVAQVVGIGWQGALAFVPLTAAATLLLFHGAERPAHRLARRLARLEGGIAPAGTARARPVQAQAG